MALVSFRTINYNPNHDPSSGEFSSGGGSSSKEKSTSGLMSKKQAELETKGTKYSKVVLHGTSEAASKDISKSGFKMMKSQTGRQYGDGIYLTPMMDSAREYAKMADNAKGKIISSKVMMKNPYMDGGKNDFTKEAFEYGKKMGIIKKSAKSIDDPPIKKWYEATSKYSNELLKEHDGVVIKGYFDDLVIVKDPSQIKIFEVKGLK